MNEPLDDNKESKRKSKAKAVDEIINYINDSYEFIHNEITLQYIFRKKKEKDFRPFNEKDASNLLVELWQDDFKIGKDKLFTLIQSDKICTDINEVHEYFNQLQPIEGDSEIKKLSNTLTQCGSFNNEQFFILFKRWLLSCYHCALGRGANQVCLVLVGRQGIYKTTWLDNVRPPALDKYYIRTPIDLDRSNKDTINLLAERIFINIDDQLDSILKKDAETLKTYITQKEVDIRKPFTRTNCQRPRISNFIASVNNTNFLTDIENRRYLVAEVSKCDTRAKIDINKVWAQVKYLVEIKKEQVYFTTEESEVQKIANEKYMQITMEQEWLQKVYRPATSKDIENEIVSYLMTSEIMQNIKTEAKDFLLKESKLTLALKRFFEQKEKRINGNSPRRVWLVVRNSEHPIPLEETTPF